MKLIVLGTIFGLFLISLNSSEALEKTVNIDNPVSATDYVNATGVFSEWIEDRGIAVVIGEFPLEERMMAAESVASLVAPCASHLKDYFSLGLEEQRSAKEKYFGCADERFESDSNDFILFQLVLGSINQNENQTKIIENQTKIIEDQTKTIEAQTKTIEAQAPLAYIGIGIGVVGGGFGIYSHFKRK